MSLVDFSDRAVATDLLARIRELSDTCGPMKIMEVCGTHTMEIGRLGLRRLLPDDLQLVSGPGCPVCVTPAGVIDAAVSLCRTDGIVLATFGDMVRVPGSETSLERAAAEGGRVEVVTSPLSLLEMAAQDPATTYVFAAVGFETTVPVIARTVQLAHQRGLDNLSFLVAHRTLPPALEALCADDEIGITGFMLPGHVSAILGHEAYFGIKGLSVPSAITGFEPLDILAGIHAVLRMCAVGEAAVTNEYGRAVRPEGNPAARALIDTVFEPVDAVWRGIGTIPDSGLALREEFAAHDISRSFDLGDTGGVMPARCSCGAVLRGVMRPDECPLFAVACTPDTPVGPCMVSSEGSCAAYFRYERAGA